MPCELAAVEESRITRFAEAKQAKEQLPIMPSAPPFPVHREAQRAAVQLLSPLSRQFQSDEMHIVFEEGVQLAWGVTPGPALDRPEEDRQPEAGDTGLSSGPLSSSESGDAPPATVPAAAPAAAAAAGTPAAAAAAAAATVTAAGQRQAEGLSLTRFLSNVVVACSQVTG